MMNEKNPLRSFKMHERKQNTFLLNVPLRSKIVFLLAFCLLLMFVISTYSLHALRKDYDYLLYQSYQSLMENCIEDFSDELEKTENYLTTVSLDETLQSVLAQFKDTGVQSSSGTYAVKQRMQQFLSSDMNESLSDFCVYTDSAGIFNSSAYNPYSHKEALTMTPEQIQTLFAQASGGKNYWITEYADAYGLLAGVWGHQKKKAARGGAISTCFDASLLDINAPIPNGEVWNMTYAASDGGFVAPVSQEELWERLFYFLERILPAAEESGVEMALHPDDPPMPELRRTARLVYKPELYQKLIDWNKSSSNKLELCLGSLQEMQSERPIYEYLDTYLAQNRVSYIHFRNVKGKVPCYDEVFVDEGDIDMLRVIRQLKAHRFEGVLIPDHTPLMNCASSWHAGMAYALGYMRAAIQAVNEED